MNLEERIEILEGRAEITKLVYDYGYTLDDQNWMDWADLFTEDATGHFDGWGETNGRDEFENFAREVIGGNFDYSAHVTHHPVIEIDGDEASGSRYMEIYYVLTDGTAAWRQGRYEEEYRRMDGEWKFSSLENRFLIRHAWKTPSEGTVENIEDYENMLNID